jgi:hypothetical protein
MNKSTGNRRRDFMLHLNFTVKAATIAGAALALAACNGQSSVENAASNDLDANMTVEEPANDASAMESATNAAETAPATDANATDASGQTSGGDTGGNNVESNVSGM